MGILRTLREGASKRFAEQRQLALQRSAANKVIQERARAEAYQERERQEIRLAREREKIRADRILQRERAVAKGGSSVGGMIDIMGGSRQQSYGLFGQQDMAKPVRKKVVRYAKVKPKPRVKRRRVVRYVTQKPQAPQRYNVTGW